MWTYFKHFLRSSFSSVQTRPVAGGFTLVELLVVSGIILLITGFVFFRQTKFNSATILRSLTYSVALSARQAQVYGTSVRGTAVSQANCTAGTYLTGACFAPGYGVYVPSSGAAANTYYIFADLNGNGAYTPGEELPVYRLGSGYRIQSICAMAVGGSTCTSASSLTIYFRRPASDACFSIDSTNSCGVGTTPAYTRAYITLGNSGNGETRSVKITDTGQIAVCSPNLAAITDC